MNRKISLCMIVGNVEEYIDRCLTSFQPIADEIIVVRAIGNQVPDNTLEIAETKFGAIVGEYLNQPGHEDWPHVDSFAAARQKSFDLATGEYCFWCDSDDVLEAGAELVREHANRGGHAAYLFPYKIFGKGVSILRERMVMRGAAKWIYPVHECLDFFIQPAPSVEDQRVIVTHLPHATKTGSNERNLRILKSIPEEEMGAGLLYHLQGELAGAGDIPGSIEAAQRALATPELGTPERYELFLNLARLADDPNHKTALLHQALQADPRRREALGLLACNAMDYGRNDIALAYARQMMATLRPARAEWNERQAAYGWLGDDIYTQALRVNGFEAEANIIREAGLKKNGGPTIALIHATRGRPAQASLARKMWLDMAEHPERIEHLFVMDSDDDDSIPLRRMHHLVVPAGGGCVAAWNYGAFATVAPIIIQMSDDWFPPAQWDTLIMERLGDLAQPKVLAVSDGHRMDRLLCMAVCTRHYWAQDWFLFHPSFAGVYSDNWFTDVAYARGQVIEARDLVFQHDHPVFTGKPLDPTYVGQNSVDRYIDGEETYRRLRSGCDWSSVPGFFNFWAFYRDIADRLQSGDVVAEVGVWLGRSIIFLAQECRRQGKKVSFLAVDTFRGEPEDQPGHYAAVDRNGGSVRSLFEANIQRCGVADMIHIVECESTEAATRVGNEALAFCFIDAAHDYASVLADIEAWRPKVRAGGIVAGHDIQSPEVARAVSELLPDAKCMPPVWMGEIQK